MRFAGEKFQRKFIERGGELGVFFHQAQVFEPELLRVGLAAVVAFVEFLHRIEMLIGVKQRAAFQTERFGNGEHLVADPLVNAEKVVEFGRRKKVPKKDPALVATFFRQLGMLSNHARFGRSVHPAIDAPDALHEAHGIPAGSNLRQAHR